MLDINRILLDFFRFYPSDHWFYKATMLKNLLENYETVEDILNLNMNDIIKEDYRKMMKAEIHFSYFQMVEALFELIFALEKLDDKNLWLYLSISRGNQLRTRIPKIINGDLIFLDEIIKLKGGYELPFIQYVFFYGRRRFPVTMLMSTGEKIEITQELLEKNFEIIKNSLRQFAKDYQDRFDYNSYKHSLRYFHNPIQIELGKMTKEEKRIPLVKFEAEDSFTFLCKNNKFIDLKTKGFDWKQDYHKITLCHNLIMNIINTRKTFLLGDRESKIALFHNQDMNEIYNHNHTLTEISTTLFHIDKTKKKK